MPFLVPDFSQLDKLAEIKLFIFCICIVYCIPLHFVHVVNCILNIVGVLMLFSPGIHSSKLFHFPSPASPPSQIPQYFERKQAHQWKILFCQSANQNGNRSKKVSAGETYLQFHVWKIIILVLKMLVFKQDLWFAYFDAYFLCLKRVGKSRHHLTALLENIFSDSTRILASRY